MPHFAWTIGSLITHWECDPEDEHEFFYELLSHIQPPLAAIALGEVFNLRVGSPYTGNLISFARFPIKQLNWPFIDIEELFKQRKHLFTLIPHYRRFGSNPCAEIPLGEPQESLAGMNEEDRAEFIRRGDEYAERLRRERYDQRSSRYARRYFDCGFDILG